MYSNHKILFINSSNVRVYISVRIIILPAKHPTSSSTFFDILRNPLFYKIYYDEILIKWNEKDPSCNNNFMYTFRVLQSVSKYRSGTVNSNSFVGKVLL